MNDYPIDDMMKAASRAKTKEDAVWAALRLLDRRGGGIELPVRGLGGTWSPTVASVERRWRYKQNAEYSKQALAKHKNGAPKYARDGTMLDDKGNRSIFDDVDE